MDDKPEIKQEQTKKEITAVYDDICGALGRMDIDGALGYFADHETMTKISNGRVLKGKHRLAEYWRESLGNVKDLRIRVENVEVHAIDDSHAWSCADEYITIDGNTRSAVVSNIFIRTSCGWKILLDHTTYQKQGESFLRAL